MLTNLRMALKALTQNKLQAILTLLGMSVGVAMVVIVSGLGLGAQQRIESQIESAGPTRITIKPGNFTPSAIDSSGQQDSGGGEQGEGSVVANGDTSANVDMSQSAAIVDARRRSTAPKKTEFKTPPTPIDAAQVAALSKIAGVKSIAGQMEGNASLDAGSPLPTAILRVSGFDAAWPDMTGWKLLEGRLPSAGEHESGAPVMLVTPAIAKRLWPDDASAVGKTVPMSGKPVKVVGVIGTSEKAGSSIVVPTVYLPNKLAGALLGRTSYDTVTIRTQSIGVTTQVNKAVTEELRKLHGLGEGWANDFRAETQSNGALPGMGSDPRLARAVHSNSAGFEQTSWEEMAKSLRQAGRTFSYLLGGAAAVSLLVGGIGVMNIMLVSVAARTREIGLRMALGARTQDVMVQFLVEAVTLAALGGLIGIALGSIGLYVTEHGFHTATAVSPIMMFVAVAMAAITGIAFGFGPARRASLLDPVIALKSE
ncbi:FtsX-like permease family protein [Sphingomonas sp. AP4-R1]|uniref:ABC transporter permease n=1 Tax=Sphingomonas sp. AP4-R1 TaxID=2735134 RepID=UPI0014938495|nr:ABC transporter permease [Sphingomonas sp. AP4-R1]QJU59601.1 FtsX-like permease family protein [Sphingomonas sp. AP4-R1]